MRVLLSCGQGTDSARQSKPAIVWWPVGSGRRQCHLSWPVVGAPPLCDSAAAQLSWPRDWRTRLVRPQFKLADHKCLQFCTGAHCFLTRATLASNAAGWRVKTLPPFVLTGGGGPNIAAQLGWPLLERKRGPQKSHYSRLPARVPTIIVHWHPLLDTRDWRALLRDSSLYYCWSAVGAHHSAAAGWRTRPSIQVGCRCYSVAGQENGAHV